MNGFVDNIYFLGIGGIGMSALARYYHRKGNKVSGYDKTPSPLTKRLEEEGIAIHYEDNPNLIPDDINMVIITPAIPSDSLELNYLREKGIKMMKRSEVLGEISNHNKSVAVSGTHGKTTVTALITHLLSYSKRKISAFVGGIARNIDSNVIIGDENDEFVVMEADEFDRSFLRLSPYVSVVTSIDADHLDIYGDTAHLEEAFNQFVAKTSSDGVVVYNAALPIKTACKSISYGYEDADVMPKNVKIENEMTKFDLVTKEGLVLGSYEMSLYGRHNVMNAMAAIIVSLQLGLDIRQIKEGLATFLGVQRRFDIRYRDEKVCYIDDYAHHPEEIKACLKAVREIYPKRKMTLVFQPHLFTRTRDFMDEFAEALSLADSLLLMEIYPAREKPLQGITSSELLKKVTCHEKQICQKDELIDTIKDLRPELIITMGAGDIDRFVPQIESMLKQ
ncbi:MAG: UDP-N-acetylmuramate--L-alanine ligase [Lentimicrobiaceae bacterium]|nr:UDP-N-acetylmuramate--L-alanine ligase [Lentimicrobiaceae bacterium]